MLAARDPSGKRKFLLSSIGYADMWAMDISLVRSFIEIVARGSFSEAAERLHVSQSTVSSRIKSLEEALGARLFERGKSGALLTVAGRHFHRHALQLVETWEHARQDVSLPERYSARLSIGSEAGLWLRLLDDWVARLRSSAPEVALRLHVAVPEILMARMAEGRFDIVVMYTPDSRPGLALSRLGEEDLILVARPDCLPRRRTGELPKNYLFVDWGRDFAAAHRAHFPEFEEPAIVVSIGILAHRLIAKAGGGAYLPLSLVEQDLESGRLARVPGAPELKLPVYAISRSGSQGPATEMAIATLREILAEKLAASG
jgi:DNA-binding transcriptional LysR family regulator